MHTTEGVTPQKTGKRAQEDQQPSAVLPDTVLEQITLNQPRGSIVVKGTVTRLVPFPRDNPRWVYGDLRGIDRAISFRCPIHNSPRAEGERVVIVGMITVRPSTIRDGLDVRVDGEPIGTWTPVEHADQLVVLEHKPGRLLLSTLLRTYGIAGLRVLASDRGASDLLAAAHKCNPRIEVPIQACSFDSKEKVLGAIKRALQDDRTKAIAFVRGGSDDATLRIWNDPKFLSEVLGENIPFYTAIGHSNDRLLADKYSDETFTTPTAFGDAIGQTLQAIDQERTTSRHLANALREKEQLEAQIFLGAQKLKRMREVGIVLVAALLLAISAAVHYGSLNKSQADSTQPKKQPMGVRR